MNWYAFAITTFLLFSLFFTAKAFYYQGRVQALKTRLSVETVEIPTDGWIHVIGSVEQPDAHFMGVTLPVLADLTDLVIVAIGGTKAIMVLRPGQDAPDNQGDRSSINAAIGLLEGWLENNPA